MPLTTWRTEARNCEDCGEIFTAHIANVDKEDRPSMTKCQSCSRKEQEQERNNELVEQLPVRIEQQRWLWWERCNLPPKFSNKTFDDFNRSIQPKAFDAAKNYSCRVKEDIDGSPNSLILLSPDVYGVGKTHLVSAIFNREIESDEREPAYIGGGVIRTRRCPLYFITEANLLLRIRSTYNNNSTETEDDIYKELSLFELLAIDDVGKVRPRDYSFLQGVYFNIIDSRYVDGQAIILTTNLDFREFESHIGGACADRLREMCGNNIIKMTGKSYRRG